MNKTTKTALAGHLLELLADRSSPEPEPQYRLARVEAQRRGYTRTSRFLAWCLAHDVPLRRENQKLVWVAPSDVDAAIARLPSKAVAKTTDGPTMQPVTAANAVESFVRKSHG